MNQSVVSILSSPYGHSKPGVARLIQISSQNFVGVPGQGRSGAPRFPSQGNQNGCPINPCRISLNVAFLVSPTATQSGHCGGVDRLWDAGSAVWHGEPVGSMMFFFFFFLFIYETNLSWDRLVCTLLHRKVCFNIPGRFYHIPYHHLTYPLPFKPFQAARPAADSETCFYEWKLT